jgi:hypothetical protein
MKLSYKRKLIGYWKGGPIMIQIGAHPAAHRGMDRWMSTRFYFTLSIEYVKDRRLAANGAVRHDWTEFSTDLL